MTAAGAAASAVIASAPRADASRRNDGPPGASTQPRAAGPAGRPGSPAPSSAPSSSTSSSASADGAVSHRDAPNGIGARDAGGSAAKASAARKGQADGMWSRPTGRVVVVSPVTATYDAGGRYPSLRIFQYARPVPESRPFGSLAVDPGPVGSHKILTDAYGGTRSSSSRFVDTAR